MLFTLRTLTYLRVLTPKIGAPKERHQSLLNLLHLSVHNGPSCHQHQIPSFYNVRITMPGRFTQQTTRSIALDGVAYFPTGGQSKSRR
jgi:hypothetical protein